jgi:hypothetical protein
MPSSSNGSSDDDVKKNNNNMINEKKRKLEEDDEAVVDDKMTKKEEGEGDRSCNINEVGIDGDDTSKFHVELWRKYRYANVWNGFELGRGSNACKILAERPWKRRW